MTSQWQAGLKGSMKESMELYDLALKDGMSIDILKDVKKVRLIIESMS